MKHLLLWLLSFIPHVVIYRDEPDGTRVKYLTRYYLLGGSRKKLTGTTSHPYLPFNLFLHCFHASDELPSHNHPWAWAKSLILHGRYWETRVKRQNFYKGELYAAYYDRLTCELYRPGMVNRIAAETYHYVQLLTPTVWTLFLVGPNVQSWGFLTEDGHVRARDWINRGKAVTASEEVVDDA